ncbi:hypothetical protein KUV44_12270 [Marinobacter daepoensis]|uniref:Uncharacterized protein n=1 Tax=Marinobacter daepoensis TaxID=262077 RepID=A0ABS3BIC0_9GAMM|nr:hypothetical protein [Marinobacter daepoensis]MBN7770472.1 hypothetical protein [Marinobacter daepoensis]MBY6079918.1 hypothetical protein [Marinobacter daepoensis]
MIKKHSRKNHAENELLRTPAFLCSIGVPIALSLATGLTISINEGFSFCLNYQCFNNLVNYYKVPIGIAGISIPLGALAAAQHRSQQTMHQILLQSSQNNLTGYFTHREKFEEHCHKIFNKSTKFDADILHQTLFPNSQKGDYSLKKTDELRVVRINLESIEKKLRSGEAFNDAEKIKQEFENINKKFKELSIEYSPEKLMQQTRTSYELAKISLFLNAISQDSSTDNIIGDAQWIKAHAEAILSLIENNSKESN